MPFTLSHAAAVLPGLLADGSGRGPPVASALVAGTLAPATAYHAASAAPRLPVLGGHAHPAFGTVTVDVLIAAVCRVCGCCCGNRCRPCCRRGPGAGRTRSPAASPGAAGRPPACRCGAGSPRHREPRPMSCGIRPHTDRWCVRWVPVLDERVLDVPLHHQLRYGGSVMVPAVLAAFLLRAWRRLPRTRAPGLPVFSVLPPARAGAAALREHRAARTDGAGASGTGAPVGGRPVSG